MRRHANQSREDAYKSSRDYQKIITEKSICLQTNNIWSITLDGGIKNSSGQLIAWGGFFTSTNQSQITVSIHQGEELLLEKSIELDNNWRRFGNICTAIANEDFTIKLTGRTQSNINIWGLSAGTPNLPLSNNLNLTLEDFAHPHLVPETYYLDHSTAICLNIKNYNDQNLIIRDGIDIQIKKCSYCARFLPLDSDRLGTLSFHKHNAKLSGHQNECRACKKWRINNQFNPIRTPDQLHESSVITRERKILLREPERLKAIRDRNDKGLRSQVWERFEKKCFKCGNEVTLKGFQLDHTRPLAYLWPIDEFATCLCAKCNNEKKEKFPVEFYNTAELLRLAQITKLPINDLQTKSINLIELDRILKDLPSFAQAWEARVLFAISRKIKELMPDIDIIKLLAIERPDLHQQFLAKYSFRTFIDDEE